MSGYLSELEEREASMAMDFLMEVAVMRWIQESSDAATPCGKHRYQVLDNLRTWCTESLPEDFRARMVFVPFRTISEPFLRQLHTGDISMAEHCPSFLELVNLPTRLNRCLVSIFRRPASGNSWRGKFSHEEARDLGMGSGWLPGFRRTPSVLLRDDQGEGTEVSMAIDGGVPASASSVP